MYYRFTVLANGLEVFSIVAILRLREQLDCFHPSGSFNVARILQTTKMITDIDLFSTLWEVLGNEISQPHNAWPGRQMSESSIIDCPLKRVVY
jgi:hypothetical protein